MNKEMLSQLELWQSYKYSELCTLLGESEKQGNSKKAQEKEWSRYFEFIKSGKNKGTRYTVYDVYETEKRKVPTGNSKYIKMIEELLSYVLIGYCESQEVDEVKIITDWKNIAYTLYIYNYSIWWNRSYMKEVAKEHKISERAFATFMYNDGRYIQTKIDCALNDMVKNKEIIWNKIYVGKVDDGTYSGANHTLTEQEYLKYSELEKKLIRQYAPFCMDTGKGMWTIISRDKQKDFYNELNNLAAKELGIWGVYPKYEIHTRKRLMMYAAERLTDMEYRAALQKLNDEICGGLQRSKVMLCHQKELNFVRDGKHINVPEKNLVTEQERDYLVGLIHGLDGSELAADKELRELRNDLDMYN